jgi:hypothetical protein
MTTPRSRRSPIVLRRMTAVMKVRMRRVVRTRVALAALAFALLPWALVEATTLLGRMSALAEFSLVGLTVLAAGAIGDDLDSGEYAVVLAHDTSPFEVLLGNAAASLVLASALVALQLPLALASVGAGHVMTVLLCLWWLSALLAGWLSLMLLLATVLEGKSNAIAMIPVLFVPLVLQTGLVDRLPRAFALATRTALQLLPQSNHATALFRSITYRTPAPALPPVVLVVSPFLYFALASYRLHRLEPAGRLTQ